ncbi:MAG TPA: type II secretion system protein GspN [Polyangiaceae bacterium]
MKERLLKYAKYAPLVGYPVFYLFCLFVFAALTFPYDKLRQRIVASFNADQHTTGGTQELRIDEMSGYWLSGVRVRGVTLSSAATEPGKPPSKIEIDEATVRYQILPALIGHSDIHFDVYAFGGEATGSYDVSGKDKSLEVALDSVDMGEIDPLVGLLGVPLQGKLSGTVRLALPEGKTAKGNGAVSLEASGVAVGDGKAKIKGAIALPKIDVGTLTLAADAKDGALKITKLAAGGKDVELQGDGRITMRDSVGESLCDANVRFKINDAYRGKNDITKTLFGAPGSTAPPLFELADPKIKQSKRADGFYGWTLRGSLARLEFIPAGGGGVGVGGGAAPPIMPFGGAGKPLP